ncbi:hypothetical protein D3C80_2032040 [compost metagenome]
MGVAARASLVLLVTLLSCTNPLAAVVASGWLRDLAWSSMAAATKSRVAITMSPLTISVIASV